MSGPDPYCLTCHGTGQDPRDPEKLCLGCQPYYPPVVDREQGRRWLKGVAAAVVGALIGIALGNLTGPQPSWVVFVVLAVFLVGSWTWQLWRARRRERERARAGERP